MVHSTIQLYFNYDQVCELCSDLGWSTYLVSVSAESIATVLPITLNSINGTLSHYIWTCMDTFGWINVIFDDLWISSESQVYIIMYGDCKCVKGILDGTVQCISIIDT